MSAALSKLRLALGLAVAFLIFRLLYAVVFTGASGGSTLIPLPGLRLSGVFSHVVLFGSIGDLGLQKALQAAIPFSAAIFAFGLLSIWITPSKVIGFGSRSRSGLAGALAIGLATLPSLIDAAKRIVVANKLRSERRSQILVPLLETAIEKAVAIGIRFAMAPRDCAPKGDSVWLKNKDLELELLPGDVIVISGATGSGKTTLLETLIGVDQLRTGRIASSSVRVFGHEPAKNPTAVSGLIGYVPQQPRNWFISDSVEQELISPSLPWVNFGAESLSQISEGQAVKLSISNALAHKPKLLVLDEPFAALDSQSQAELNALIHTQSQAGVIVVIAEHQLESIDQPNAKWFHLGDSLQPGKYVPASLFTPRKLPVVGRELLLDYNVPKIRDLALPPRLQIHQSERIALLGPNGIGKTSLLTQLNADFPTSRMVPERVEDFFVCQSVAEELTRADRVAKADKGLTQLTFESLVPVDQGLLNTHPRDLSAGTKLALALAMQLSFKPQLLMVDEPVKGLDPLARERAAEVLACVAETGCAIVFATHDETFALSADTRVELSVVKQ